MARVQVGIFAERDADGNFFPAVPIYREVAGEEDADLTDEYLPLDAFAQIVTPLCKKYFEEEEHETANINP